MQPVAIATLLLTAVIVGVMAFFLINTALVLKHVNSTLGDVIGGVRAIELATQPVEPVLGQIAGDLDATNGALKDLLYKKKMEAAGAKPVIVRQPVSAGPQWQG
jgi:hypothetical protein